MAHLDGCFHLPAADAAAIAATSQEVEGSFVVESSPIIRDGLCSSNASSQTYASELCCSTQLADSTSDTSSQMCAPELSCSTQFTDSSSSGSPQTPSFSDHGGREYPSPDSYTPDSSTVYTSTSSLAFSNAPSFTSDASPTSPTILDPQHHWQGGILNYGGTIEPQELLLPGCAGPVQRDEPEFMLPQSYTQMRHFLNCSPLAPHQGVHTAYGIPLVENNDYCQLDNQYQYENLGCASPSIDAGQVQNILLCSTREYGIAYSRTKPNAKRNKQSQHGRSGITKKSGEKCRKPRCNARFQRPEHRNRHEHTTISCGDSSEAGFDCPLALCLGTAFCEKVKSRKSPVKRSDNLNQHHATHTADGPGQSRNCLVATQITFACIAKIAETDEEADRLMESVKGKFRGKADYMRCKHPGKKVTDPTPNAHIPHHIMEDLGFDCSDGHPVGPLEDLDANVVRYGELCRAWVPPKRKGKFSGDVELGGSSFTQLEARAV